MPDALSAPAEAGKANPIAIEAQVLRELGPADVVRAAAEAGFAMSGVWIDSARWTAAMTREVRAAFADTGVAPLDAEVVRIAGGVEADQLRLIDIAGELGVPNVIAISLTPDAGRTEAALAALAEHGAPAGVRVAFEFGRFSAVATLAEALAVLDDAGPEVGLLPDPLHLHRSGGEPRDLTGVAPERIAFAQICDVGPAPNAPTREALLHEARHERRDLGGGVLPLADYVAALPPGVALSNEVRSLEVERRHPDPYKRAAALAANMRACLREWREGAG